MLFVWSYAQETPVYAQTVIDAVEREKALFARVVQELSIKEKPCPLVFGSRSFGLGVVFCGDTETDVTIFQKQFDDLLEKEGREFFGAKWRTDSVQAENSVRTIFTNVFFHDQGIFEVMYTPAVNGNAFVSLIFSHNYVSVADESYLQEYISVRNLESSKVLASSVINEFFTWFGGQESTCDINLQTVDTNKQGIPSCVLVPWTLDQLKEATFDLSQELPQMSFSGQDDNYTLEDNDFMRLSDGVYVSFYFLIVEDGYNYILRFVEREGENVLVLYPPLFE